ncbi:metal-sulfur cluster assembly factor [Haladaptatus pallidirubidus]|uniref:MIP18 family-like domain-containing protein n=1 Tax=Haladaptatus pallidirubidus TaxID=1008152 RepID=A0AAV3UIH7_9EURY|nr:metal-sulfur cluster assembly factor [Haladaptatus pallidirubidus]
MSTNTAPTNTDEFTLGPDAETSSFEQELWTLIDEIPDPHIPVSLVEMGMIYEVNERDGDVTVEMTFPCMGCPAYEFIQTDIKSILRPVEGVESVTIDIVWDPVWSKDMLEPEVQEKMRNAGISL